jgi:hypothetical protein
MKSVAKASPAHGRFPDYTGVSKTCTRKRHGLKCCAIIVFGNRRQLRVKKKTVLFIAFNCAAGALAVAQTNPVSPSESEFKRTRSPVAPTKRLHPVVLQDGRVILSVSDTVYMLDAEGHQVWKFVTASANETLTSEPAFSATANEVAVIGSDLLFVRLDATTGKAKWRADSVGRGAFTSVAAYENGFVVVVDMSAYRTSPPPTPDRLEYWDGSDEDSWSIAFPLKAELVVTGKKIYALRSGADKLRFEELHPPKRHKNTG